jgi:hypothetical protein
MTIACAFALVNGCGPPRASHDARPPTDTSTRPGTSADALVKPGVSLFDGFEDEAVATFWRAGNAGEGRFEPRAVAISQKFARAGSSSVQITVREGDIEQKGDDGKLTERAELDSGKHAFVGRDAWYGFSVLLPPGFPIVDNRLVIAQWKQAGVSGSPVVAQRFRAGRHDLTIRVPNSTWGQRKRYRLPKIESGRWNDMIYHIKFSAGDDGSVDVWMNRKQVVAYKGATAFKSGEGQIYNKVGLYRDRWKEPMTIYFDNYTLGEGFLAVDPARFDKKPDR